MISLYSVHSALVLYFKPIGGTQSREQVIFSFLSLIHFHLFLFREYMYILLTLVTGPTYAAITNPLIIFRVHFQKNKHFNFDLVLVSLLEYMYHYVYSLCVPEFKISLLEYRRNF